MEEHLSPTLTLGPVTFDLTMVLVSVITISIIFLLVFWASRRMELKPKGKQNVLEYVYELTINFTKGILAMRKQSGIPCSSLQSLLSFWLPII